LEAYSLVEVNQYIRQVIAVNFQDSIWVKAEISQIKESRGAYYLELVEKKEDSDEVIASSGAVIWYKSALFIRNKLKDLTNQILTEGIHIQCKAKIEFHEKYGLKFSIEDIDPAFTFGQMEIKRQETIEKLRKEGLLHKNAEVPLPLVLQKIAVISSSKAAGLEDFMNQLHHNRYGYAFQTTLFESSVQGQNQEKEIIQALTKVEKAGFDCVVIIRGGGSKLDLSGFDSYPLAKSAALCSKPVLTGIGHETDQTIIELVVNTPLKTPTAVANFIIDHNLQFESMIQNLQDRTAGKVGKQISKYLQEIMDLSYIIRHESLSQVERFRIKIQRANDRVIQRSEASLISWKNSLDKLSDRIRLNDPANILSKGYSITLQEGKVIRSVNGIDISKPLTTLMADGQVDSLIDKVLKKDHNEKN
jgi:exodeoxyribonuclease VII large subunit